LIKKKKEDKKLCRSAYANTTKVDTRLELVAKEKSWFGTKGLGKKSHLYCLAGFKTRPKSYESILDKGTQDVTILDLDFIILAGYSILRRLPSLWQSKNQTVGLTGHTLTESLSASKAEIVGE
jgi:hypothetical protein